MSNDECLESELIRIVQEYQRPLNLEEIFSCLYDRRDRLSELMAANKETILEKRRVKRFLDRSAHQGVLKASYENGEILYQATTSFRLSIIRERGRVGMLSGRPFNDSLLNAFCIIALSVLAVVISFYFLN